MVFRQQKSTHSAAASKKRWGKVNDNNGPVMQPQCDGNASAMPTPEAIYQRKKETTSLKKNRGGLNFAFETWWEAYPHKIGKGAALKAFEVASRLASLNDLIHGVERYILEKPPDREWCNPAKWLIESRWLDKPAPVALKTKSIADVAKDMIDESRNSEFGDAPVGQLAIAEHR